MNWLLDDEEMAEVLERTRHRLGFVWVSSLSRQQIAEGIAKAQLKQVVEMMDGACEHGSRQKRGTCGYCLENLHSEAQEA